MCARAPWQSHLLEERLQFVQALADVPAVIGADAELVQPLELAAAECHPGAHLDVSRQQRIQRRSNSALLAGLVVIGKLTPELAT